MLIPRQQVPRCGSRNPTYPKIDTVLDSPSLFLTSQNNSSVGDFVELNEGLEELRVGFGVAEVATEENGKLVQSVQTASSDHVEQFFGRECEGCGLNGAGSMSQGADQPWTRRHRLGYFAKKGGKHWWLTAWLSNVAHTSPVN